MSKYSENFRAAVVQAEPVWNDLAGGIEKTIALATEAKSNGAEIIAFPEVWIPGYPWFLWLDSVPWQSQFVPQYARNSLTSDSPEFRQLESAAKNLGIAIALGFSERDHGSLYISQALIDDDGITKSSRRKLKPTHVERTQFGDGDGSDLQVVDTNKLGRVGSLSCWEHLQPLSRYAMFAQHEQLHVAAWPSFSIFEGQVHALGPEVNVGAARHYAVEGQCFVLSPCATIGEAGQNLYADTEIKREFLKTGGGYARIFGPDGSELTTSLAPHEEGIIYGDIDYNAILVAKNAADPVGHYSRSDVFRVLIDSRQRPKLEFTNDRPTFGTTTNPEPLGKFISNSDNAADIHDAVE